MLLTAFHPLTTLKPKWPSACLNVRWSPAGDLAEPCSIHLQEVKLAAMFERFIQLRGK